MKFGPKCEQLVENRQVRRSKNIKNKSRLTDSTGILIIPNYRQFFLYFLKTKNLFLNVAI
tara:strand:+ start:235 stop:414 length:180 start_codon:yes stop_codon:yes gene_type:complete